MTHDLPPLTLDVLMEVTGKSRRNMQDIVRQYLLITGDQAQYYKRRNFLEMRLTEQQRDLILQGMQLADELRISYADAFRQLASDQESPSGWTITRADWTAMTEGLTDLRTYVGTLESRLDELTKRAEALTTSNVELHSKLDRLQETLDKALSPME